MYTVETLAGHYLAKFASIGRARFFAAHNKPCQLKNKAGKVIQKF